MIHEPPQYTSTATELASISLPPLKPVQMAIEVASVDFKYTKKYLDLNTLMYNPLGYISNLGESTSVLQKISIAAPKGKIFALLGASGCGKTTLLKCILGQLEPLSGEIRIFGQKPGSRNCPVPGPGVGYMPQELALFPELTIAETLRFFGQLYKMNPEKVAAQIEYLIALLNLPSSDRLIKQLSGGQQRRVSLSCALIHQPPLMILDEPTVGVDPLLRLAIWEHLESLCQKQNLTVIMTTHYIEEARAAETIGLMRNGRLLVQANPQVLMAQHNLPTLEDIFLKLSVLQDSHIGGGQNGLYFKSDREIELNNTSDNFNSLFPEPNPHPIIGKRPAFFDPYRFYAHLVKNSITLRRNVLVTLFYCFLPALQFTLFMFCTGKSPRDIPVAVYNEEAPAELTARFLHFIDPVALSVVNKSSVLDAEDSVRNGQAWAAIHFHSNFSTAMEERRTELVLADDEVVTASNLHLYLDLSNPIIGSFVMYNFLRSFFAFMTEYLSSIGYNPNVLSAPMTVTEVIYGSMDMNSMAMTQFIIPGLIILIAFFSTAAVAGLALILEQKDGLLKRSLVAGVQPLESLLAHVFTQTAVLVVQQVLLFLTIFFVFSVHSRGPLAIIFIICFSQGVAGIMYGLFISSLFPDEVSAAIVTMGSFIPTIMISGIMWPIKSISIYLHWISLFLPQTLAMHSVRSVLSRGWALEHTEVWLGFWASGAWVTIYLLLAAFLFSKFL